MAGNCHLLTADFTLTASATHFRYLPWKPCSYYPIEIKMNTSRPIPFTMTEEAFLLNCVKEVMKVWATKSGKADMNISVINGMADLQLNFRLGSPRD